MRLAIISDIHSNLEALTKAMEVIDQHNVDEIICLGDIVGYGANPNECVDLVRQRCTVVIKGNHDEAVRNTALTEHFTHDARAAINWTREQLTERNSEYLLELPHTHTMEDLLFVHSSPCDPAEWNYILERAGAAAAFPCFSELICFIGHTHIPAIFSTGAGQGQVTKEDRFIINVGSIGQPRDRNTNLSFGLFDTRRWSYENIRCPYDMETASWKILKTTLPPRLGQRLLMGM
ncbi:MAG: metallophosphoesterase [Ignavibacteriae bacterium]|nr:MAG: metallophosphoesterase [Ignavibacteriota bacterium]